jgi:pimeloyl-ACP methyl ester carboxylesterase
MAIQPFQIKVPEQILTDLRVRIERTRWPDEITGSGWEYGASLSYMKELAEYWLNKYDWRKTENEINAYPNFIADIDGYKIHFLHVKGKGKRSVPLIITHGWPGSFLEMMKLIHFLTNNPEFAFDLVVPSLMGFGFSQTVTEQGCDIHLMADLWFTLMKELGYETFGAHGGDFGSGVGTALALKYPKNVVGLHVNNIEGYYAPHIPDGERVTDEEIQFEKQADEWYDKEGAYSHQQRTKPLTLSYGLNDSPIGLCAWIIEKFYGWADLPDRQAGCNGNIESVFTRDELLANVTLFWVTETIHSSIRLYNESRKTPLHFTKDDFVKIPVGIARFPFEEPFPPRKYIERGFNVQRWTNMPAGGHFAAMEKPELLADDIREFFRSLNLR